MANIPDNENWRNFFDSYRNLPELWDFKRFKYRGNRDRFFDKLLDTYQDIHENATIDDLKKRLANIRRCYYREMDKLISEKKKGRTYESTLWYFDLLKFLKDPELRERQERMKNGAIEGINEDGPPTMGCIPDNPAWEIFFDFYRGLPELWDYRSILYKDKRKRNQSFARLLDIYRMICKDATFEDLKKRVTNIKRCYRREAIKKEEFEKSGHPSYIPNLWYFEYVDFLSYPDAQVDTETQQSCLVEVNEYGQIAVNEPRKASSEYRHSRPPLTYEESKKRLQSYLENRLKEAAKKAANKKRRRLQISDDENDIYDSNLDDDDEYTPKKKTPKKKESLQISVAKKKAKNSPYITHFDALETQDEASAYADSWAASFRNLSDTQKIYAKKAIEDILVLGQLDCLAVNTVDVISASGNAPNP